MNRHEFGRQHVVIAFAAAAVLVLGFVAYDGYKAATGDFDSAIFRLWYWNSKYSEIRRGMNKDRVLSILGKPQIVKLNPLYQIWDYNLPPSPTGGGHTYTVDGYDWEYIHVYFDPLGRVTRIVAPAVLQDKLWPHGGPRPGMTNQEVRKLAGKPDYIMDNSKVAFEFWTYRLWNGTWFSVLLDGKGKVIRTWHVDAKAGFKD